MIGQSLLISMIGMGLVFGVILMLWLFMELIVRFTEDKPESGRQTDPIAGEAARHEVREKRAVAAAAAVTAMQLRKRQAAAVAVALALAKGMEPEEGQAKSQPASSWQSVMRSLQRRERSRLFSRKPRGRD